MEQNNSSLPKKNPLSMQINLDKFAPATEEEKRQQDVMSKSTTFFRDGMRKLFKNPLAVGSLIVLSLIIITIIVAPMIVPYKYSEILSVNGRRDKGAKNMAPFTYSEMEQEYIAQGGQRFPHIFRHRRAVPRLFRPRNIRHPRIPLRRPLRQHHSHDNRRHIRQYIRLFRR